MSFFPPAIGAVSVTQSDVRQTVNTGPVNSSGRADFLEAGTGLQVVTKDVDSSTPLNITFGDGFDSNGKRDVLTVVSSSLSWDDLPDNTDGISLFIRLSGASVTTFSQTLAPNYSLVRPSSPSDGQTWYPVDHRSRMEIYDDGDWDNEDLIICVGECSTDGGAVVDVRSYAYQAQASVFLETPTRNTLFTLVHNVGTKEILADQVDIFKSAVSGYSIGDRVDWKNAGHAHGGGTSVSMGSNFTYKSNVIELTVADSLGNFYQKNTKTGGNGTINVSNVSIKLYIYRAF